MIYVVIYSANPVWSNKDPQLNNFDWGTANGAFDR